MRTLTFAVKEPRHAEQVLDVIEERILVGSGAHCDLRLPVESAAWEHIVITDEDGVFVARVISASQTTTFDGAARREATLAEGSTITVGGVVIQLRRIVGEASAPQRASSLGKVIVAGSAIIVVLAACVLGKARADAQEATWPTPPDPLPAPVGACPEKQGAAPLAIQKLELARAKRQRFRFYPRDGIEAVGLFETAAACFTATGDAASASDAQEAARALSIEIREALHVSSVRLERAVVRKDAGTALAQTKFQRDLLFGRAGADAYLAWLALLQSKLEAASSKG